MKLFNFLTRNPYGAFFFSIIGLVLGYFTFTKYLHWGNLSAVLGIALVWIIIVAVNIKNNWE